MASRGGLLSIFLLSLTVLCHAGDVEQIGFDQKIGAVLPTKAPLLDETGKVVNLGQYLGNKPIILSFVYFGCPNLCTLVLNGIVDSLGSAGLNPGKDVQILSISINPNEKPSLALAKKRTYLARFGQTGDENLAWHFLTASEEVIQVLTAQAGFHFKYDPISQEYNHPSGFVLLSPSGKISRYFFGLRFDPKELTKAISDASLGRSRKTIAEIILNCFHYRPENGKYGKIITLLLQWASLVTIVSLGGLFVWLGFSRKRGAS